ERRPRTRPTREETMRKPLELLLLATAVILSPAMLRPILPAAALSETSSVDRRLRLDWEARTRRGRPGMPGAVYHAYLRPGHTVRLLVEVLDASGAVTGRTVGFVFGVVPFNDRSYFEVPLKTPGASYRVSITDFDWKDVCGSGGGM